MLLHSWYKGSLLLGWQGAWFQRHPECASVRSATRHLANGALAGHRRRAAGHSAEPNCASGIERIRYPLHHAIASLFRWHLFRSLKCNLSSCYEAEKAAWWNRLAGQARRQACLVQGTPTVLWKDHSSSERSVVVQPFQSSLNQQSLSFSLSMATYQSLWLTHTSLSSLELLSYVCKGTGDKLVTAAINSVSQDPGIQQLLPYFSQFISEEVILPLLLFSSSSWTFHHISDTMS